MLLLAAQARIDAHPDEAADLIGKLPIIQETDFTMENYSDLVLAYPFIALGRANEESGSNVCFGYAQRGEAMYQRAKDAGLLGPWEPGETPVIESFPEIALTASLLATRGRIEADQSLTRSAYALLLDTLTRLEGRDKVWEGDLESLIGRYKYREGPNAIFTASDPDWRDKMWLLWGIERTLAESEPVHVPDLHPLLERQYRLLVAFCNEWQDANAMIGGTGDLGEKVDMPSQGLSLSSMADFKPWRRWELNQLGYSMNIYATPLFDFPIEHLFYILGQANALAGAWTADERLKLFVNDDGSIRGDLMDRAQSLKPGDEGYALDAGALAYGLSRFEKADYGLFDLELYPIVGQ
jgi:hypothetical protein